MLLGSRERKKTQVPVFLLCAALTAKHLTVPLAVTLLIVTLPFKLHFPCL